MLAMSVMVCIKEESSVSLWAPLEVRSRGITVRHCVQVDGLCAVWVSHKHADHMLGLPGILSARSASAPPLLVSAQTARFRTNKGPLVCLEQ